MKKNNNGIIIFDLDMYSNRIGFFSNNRERIGSWLGLFLTLAYILSLIIIFIIYSIDTIKRKDIRVYESNIFTNKTPSIEINSNDLNLAFGLEDPKSSHKYLDPSIYYPEIHYIDTIKKEEGKLETIIRQELNFSRCNNNSFGENYKGAFYNIKFNNSYCLKDFNLTLAGGDKYEKMSFIRIQIKPCKNGTNPYICKPKEIIDGYLTKGYLSIFIKDVGLNPGNFNIPIIPTIQNIHTTIDKRIYKDIILNFGITEIYTDTSLFYENFHKKEYLQFVNEKESFYFRNQEEFDQGKHICSIQIRIDDSIHIQKRTYKKIQEIFSLIGGYMQLLSTIFSLISILTNLDLEVKILNNLFDFNIKQNKMTIKINNIKDLNSNKYKNYKTYTKKKNFIMKKIKSKSNRNINISINNSLNNINNSNNNNNNKTKKNIIIIDNNSNQSIFPIIKNRFKKIEENGENSQQIINNSNYMDNKKSLFCNNNISSIIINNNNNNNNNGSNSRTKSLKQEDKVYFRPIRLITSPLRIKKNKNNNQENQENEDDKNIHLNLINYYCCGYICKMKKHIDLFDIGVSLYRKRMDIINVFTILLLAEKLMLKLERQKNFSFNKETIEVPPPPILDKK